MKAIASIVGAKPKTPSKVALGMLRPNDMFSVDGRLMVVVTVGPMGRVIMVREAATPSCLRQYGMAGSRGVHPVALVGRGTGDGKA